MGALDGQWVAITVDLREIEGSVPAEVVLFGDNPDGFHKLSLSILEILPESVTRRIDTIAMLASEPRSPAGLITAVLDMPLRQIRRASLSVSVYDVGRETAMQSSIYTSIHVSILISDGRQTFT